MVVMMPVAVLVMVMMSVAVLVFMVVMGVMWMAVPVTVLEMHPVVAGLKFLFSGGLTLDSLDPSSRGRNAVEVEQSGIQQPVKVHLRIVAFYYLRLRLKHTYDLPYPAELLRTDFRCLVQEYYIAELYLLYDQILDVFIIYILACQAVSAGEFALHAERIDHCHYAVEPADAVFAVCLAESRYGTYRLGDRFRLAYAAGLDDNIVEPLHLHQLEDLLHEVRFQSAAYASVLQCHETVVLASHDTAFLDELGIDVDFSYVIDNYGKPYSFPV